MYESFSKLASSKLLSDKFEFQTLQMENNKAKLLKERKDIDKQLYDLSSFNTEILKDLKDMRDHFSKTVSKKDRSIQALKEKKDHLKE